MTFVDRLQLERLLEPGEVPVVGLVELRAEPVRLFTVGVELRG